MKKPENIYQERWYLFVNYNDFLSRGYPFQLPMEFGNAGISHFDPDNNPKEFEKVILEIWDDYNEDSEHSEYLQWIKSYDRYIYYLEWENVDDMTEFQDLLDKLLEPKATMTIQEYYQLTEILPKFKEFKIPFYEEAEDSSTTQETTSQDSPEPAE